MTFGSTTAYGGKAEVPGDVDVLIAGFCCTDYSKLNNKPMTLAERGESGQTFYAILAYALEYKPKIIILENVVRVPWNDKIAKKRLGERGLDQHFGLIGYTSRHLILDAKEFYVPQTRQRGYLIAIHRESFKGSDEEIEGLLDQWEKDVTKLQRPASVPAEALLLKSDDPNLKFVQRENVEKGEGKKELFWNRCKMGHQLYRSALKLGVEHPITKWGPSGSKQLFDYYRTFKGFTERVLDTLDISHLRCIKRGFDDRYWKYVRGIPPTRPRMLTCHLADYSICRKMCTAPRIIPKPALCHVSPLMGYPLARFVVAALQDLRLCNFKR